MMIEVNRVTTMAGNESKGSKRGTVKALFSYAPVNDDELELKVNDILEIIEETEEGWWKGKLNGKVGMFPSNFVTKLEADDSKSKSEIVASTKILVKGLDHDNNSVTKQSIFDAKQNLINVSGGSVVDGSCISKTSTESEKKTANRKSQSDSIAPRLPPKPVRELAHALFPYEAQNEDEISLKKGDIVTIITKEVEDKGWWKGELNGKIGVFPDNFVKLVKSEEQKKPERPDKPSTVLTNAKAALKHVNLDKNVSESSPNQDKKIQKTPPAKPPPPEIHKKAEPERPTPPCPSKKPQTPPTQQTKSSHTAIGVKLPGFPFANPLKSPISESTPSLLSSVANSIDKFEGVTKGFGKDKLLRKGDSELDLVESSGKKLIHLTANRAKAPNRRPPSQIFFKDSEKENGFELASRRLSEPLLDEMNIILPLADDLSTKVSVTDGGQKAKLVPPKPAVPSAKSTVTINQNSTIVANVSITEDNAQKETPKSSSSPQTTAISSVLRSPALPEAVSPTFKVQSIQSKISQLPLDDESSKDSHLSVEEEIRAIREDAKVLRDVPLLLQQFKELKDELCSMKTDYKQAVAELKRELEQERSERLKLQTELDQLKNDSQNFDDYVVVP